MSRLTMGSLFDGIGGFPLAAIRSGITPVWASEIEAFPSRSQSCVSQHDPCGRHHKAEWCRTAACGHHLRRQPVSGSVRCWRKGRSCGGAFRPFMEQMRIVREMRAADQKRGRFGVDIRPRWVCWENVPGAFSSGTPKYEDFRIVLEEIVRICFPNELIPSPYPYAWPDAGELTAGGAFSCMALSGRSILGRRAASQAYFSPC